MKPILECNEVYKFFGEFRALNNISFTIPEGVLFGIAGPNGAGKTTLFNVITGNPFPLSSGKIFLEGEEIQKLKPYEIAHKGMERTFQIPVIYKSLNYFKSVMVGSIYGNFTSLKQNIFGYNKNKFERNTLEALEFVGLANKKDDLAIHASLYDLKLLMIASALAMRPKILFLDEPVSGLTGNEIEKMIDITYKINKDYGITTIIIEHIMKFLMNISDEVMILHYGEIISKGKPEDVSSDDRVIECYLGEEYKDLLKKIEGGAQAA